MLVLADRDADADRDTGTDTGTDPGTDTDSDTDAHTDADTHTRQPRTHRAGICQRHINGVVSKNNKYNNFGVGGIKGPF